MRGIKHFATCCRSNITNYGMVTLQRCYTFQRLSLMAMKVAKTDREVRILRKIFKTVLIIYTAEAARVVWAMQL